MEVKKNFIVLFQGDSVTDAERSREDDTKLGEGYPNLVAAWFNALYPELNVRFINKGKGGNRAIDLKARWEEDCISIKPDVVSILIGINDTWRRFDCNDPTSAEVYKENFRSILIDIKEKLNAKVVICEPFLLPFTEEQKKNWREDLDPKIQAARELAREFNAIYVPLDGIFATASTKREPAFWSEDGVHPTQAGHAIIAQAWLEAVKAI